MEQRPKTSQMVIDEFARIIDSQDHKGLEKYGKSIDDANNQDYNWELMVLEETADLQKYLVRRILELKKELRLIKSKPWFKVYQENLDLVHEINRLKSGEYHD